MGAISIMHDTYKLISQYSIPSGSISSTVIITNLLNYLNEITGWQNLQSCFALN